MNLPTKAETKHLLDFTFRVPQNILRHCAMVNKVAVFLAEQLAKKGEQINIDLVDRASILHDSLKVIDIDNGSLLAPPNDDKIVISKKDRMKWIELKQKYRELDHEKAAYKMFKQNFPEMAEVIRKHGFHYPEGEFALKTWEEKLVYYADKRVLHDKIVSLRYRLDDGAKRYAKRNVLTGIDEEYSKKTEEYIFELEKEIFNKIDMKPEEIETLLRIKDD